MESNDWLEQYIAAHGVPHDYDSLADMLHEHEAYLETTKNKEHAVSCSAAFEKWWAEDVELVSNRFGYDKGEMEWAFERGFSARTPLPDQPVELPGSAKMVAAWKEYKARPVSENAFITVNQAKEDAFYAGFMAAVESLPVRESGWLPMNTAPADGTRIHLGFAHMRGFDIIAHSYDGKTWLLSDDSPAHGRGKPSGWKPLGEPPTTQIEVEASTCK